MTAATAPASGAASWWKDGLALDEPCLDMLCACSDGSQLSKLRPETDIRWEAVEGRIAAECRDAEDTSAFRASGEDRAAASPGGTGGEAAAIADTSATSNGPQYPGVEPIDFGQRTTRTDRRGGKRGVVAAEEAVEIGLADWARADADCGDNPPGVEPAGSVVSPLGGNLEGGSLEEGSYAKGSHEEDTSAGYSVYERFDDAFGSIGRSGSMSRSLSIHDSWTDQLSRSTTGLSVGGGSVGGRSAGGRSATSREDPAEATIEGPAEATIPAASAAEKDGEEQKKRSRRAALVRSLVARAMAHNNEARDVLLGGLIPGADAVADVAEVEEAERAVVEEKESADDTRPSDPPTGQQSARAGLGEGGRDPPDDEPAGEDLYILQPHPARPGRDCDDRTAASLPTSVLCRPRDIRSGSSVGYGRAPSSAASVMSARPRPDAPWQQRSGASLPPPRPLGGYHVHNVAPPSATDGVDGRRAAIGSPRPLFVHGGHGHRTPEQTASSYNGAYLLPPLPTSPSQRSVDSGRVLVPRRLGVPSLVPTSPARVSGSAASAGGGGDRRRHFQSPRPSLDGGGAAPRLASPASRLTSFDAVLGRDAAMRRREYYRNLLIAEGGMRRRGTEEGGWTPVGGMNG